MTNAALGALHPYPFERLRALQAPLNGPADLAHIALSLGEPKHPAPDFVIQALADPQALRTSLGSYPSTRGSDALRSAMAHWLSQRFAVRIDSETQVLPVAGTREALFSVAQALLSGRPEARVAMPNPFYQIYEGAALMRGAQPLYVPCPSALGYQPDFERISSTQWQAIELLYLCSPGNPTGAVADQAQLGALVELAHRHDFIIVADECYSEIYPDERTPPPGLLSAAAAAGYTDFSRCLVMNSLSKRSNLPGLRSGLVAGDAKLLAAYLQYRTYHGCALPLHTQAVSQLAWEDETHVVENRAAYRQKFAAVLPLLQPHYGVSAPAGGFFCWLPIPKDRFADDLDFTRRLFEAEHVTVLPGSFLGRSADAGAAQSPGNPGSDHVRIAWVAPLSDCLSAAQRLARFAVA